MRRILKNIVLPLALAVVSPIIYAFIVKTFNIWHIIIVFAVAVVIYYMIALGLARPLLIQKRGGITDIYQNYSTAKRAILAKLQHSQKIKITTIGGGTIFEVDWGNFIDLLEKRARVGIEIRVLILNPDSKYLEVRMEELARFKPGKFNLQEFMSRIHANVLKVKEQNKLLGLCKIQVRYYDTLPIWRLYIFDDSIFISSFLKDKEGHDTTVYNVKSGSDLYRAFERCFDHMWTIGEIPVELKESIK